jgi:hypothetical protein
MTKLHRTRIRLLTAACAVTLPVLLLSACTGTSTKFTGPTGLDTNGAALSSALNELTGSAPAAAVPTGKTSPMKMRVVNLYAPNKSAGPAIDVYDVQLTGQKATPLVTNIAYGAVSDYFSPHVDSNGIIQSLYALPAGEDPVAKHADAQGFGGAQDDGSHPQITWVLSADTGNGLSTGPLGGLSFGSRVEKGTDNGSSAPLAPAPPSGQGEIMVDTNQSPDPSTGYYIMIDNSCTPPLNGDTSLPGLPYAFAVDGEAPVSGFALFATSPGSHQVSVVGWTSSDTPTCAQLTALQGTTTVNVSAGQQIEAYVYGTSVTDLHLALAPITS